MVALRASTWRQRSGDTSWPLEVHPSLPGGVIHWLPDDPERVLINWWPSSEVGASALLARVRDGFPKEVVPRDARHGRVVCRSPGPRARGQRPQRGRHQRGRGRARRRPRAVRGARRRRHLPGDRLRVRGLRRRPEDRLPDGDRCERPQGAASPTISRSGVRRAVYAHERFDVGALVHSPVDGALWAVEVDAEKPELHFFDRAAQREQASIDKAFPSTTNRIVSFDRDGEARDRPRQRRHQPARLLPLRPRTQADGLPVHRESGRSTARSSRR